MKPATIAAAVATGMATGPRSFTGLAAVVLATPRDVEAQPDRLLGHPAVKTGVGLIALQEWVMDKLPSTPSRLEPLGLATRAVGAGAAGAILARRAQINEVQAAPDGVQVEPRAQAPGEQTQLAPPDWAAIAAGTGVAAAVALGVAAIGVRLRGMFTHLFGQDWPAAALEDMSSAGLAAAAVYVSTAFWRTPSAEERASPSG